MALWLSMVSHRINCTNVMRFIEKIEPIEAKNHWLAHTCYGWEFHIACIWQMPPYTK